MSNDQPGRGPVLQGLRAQAGQRRRHRGSHRPEPERQHVAAGAPAGGGRLAARARPARPGGSAGAGHSGAGRRRCFDHLAADRVGGAARRFRAVVPGPPGGAGARRRRIGIVAFACFGGAGRRGADRRRRACCATRDASRDVIRAAIPSACRAAIRIAGGNAIAIAITCLDALDHARYGGHRRARSAPRDGRNEARAGAGTHAAARIRHHACRRGNRHGERADGLGGCAATHRCRDAEARAAARRGGAPQPCRDRPPRSRTAHGARTRQQRFAPAG